MEKKQLDENELRRRIALDRAAVEDRLNKSKLEGRKIGGLIAAIVIIAALAITFALISINMKK